MTIQFIGYFCLGIVIIHICAMIFTEKERDTIRTMWRNIALLLICAAICFK